MAEEQNDKEEELLEDDAEKPGPYICNLFNQPVRMSAEVQFSTNIWPRLYQHIKSIFFT